MAEIKTIVCDACGSSRNVKSAKSILMIGEREYVRDADFCPKHSDRCNRLHEKAMTPPSRSKADGAADRETDR